MENILPKISIIMPSLNQGQFIEESIQSVINQKYSNLEFIIIDGKSSDKSPEIIKKYEKHLKFWTSEKDKGHSHAINKGFKIATGEIINWINSDDILAKSSLFKIGEYFKNNPQVDIIIGKSHLIDNEGHIIKLRNTINYSSSALWSLSATMCQPSVFFRRKILDKIGLLDETLEYVMDQDLYFRMDLNKFTFEKVPFTISYFRIHTGAKGVHSRQKFYDQLDYLINKKYLCPFPKFTRYFLFYFFRAKRFLIAIPIKIKFFIKKKKYGLMHYSIYEDKFQI